MIKTMTQDLSDYLRKLKRSYVLWGADSKPLRWVSLCFRLGIILEVPGYYYYDTQTLRPHVWEIDQSFITKGADGPPELFWTVNECYFVRRLNRKQFEVFCQLAGIPPQVCYEG